MLASHLASNQTEDVGDHDLPPRGKKAWQVRFCNIKKQPQACESESDLGLTLAWSADWIDRIRGVDRDQTLPGARRREPGIGDLTDVMQTSSNVWL
jgi:hypothetical protein